MPFANNVIPDTRIHSISRQLLGLYPLPNAAGTGAGSLTNNYRREERRTFDRHNYDAKVNFNRTAAHQIWGKLSYMDAVVDDLTIYLGPDPDAEGDGGFTKVHQFTAGQTWTVGSTLVWDATAQNMADEDGWVGLSWNTPSELHRNFATAGYDRTHNFQMGFLYELPWKSDGGYGNAAKAVIADWQINGVFGAFSGTPFTVGASGTVLNTPGNAQTADLVGDVTHIGAIGASGTYYDPAAWRQPTGVRFGDTGRNQFRGPGGINLDFSIFRTFPLGGARRLELRGEAFNLTNTPKFGNPDSNVTSGNFMRIFGTLGAYGERQYRLGLRFAF